MPRQLKCLEKLILMKTLTKLVNLRNLCTTARGLKRPVFHLGLANALGGSQNSGSGKEFPDNYSAFFELM